MDTIFLLSMPGGAEWFIILIGIFLVIGLPILAIVFYVQNRQLKNEVARLTEALNNKS